MVSPAALRILGAELAGTEEIVENWLSEATGRVPVPLVALVPIVTSLFYRWLQEKKKGGVVVDRY